jgi:hypothetical protein
MVDALREIRRTVVPGGTILDVRPISEQHMVEVVPASGAAAPLGGVDAYGALEEDRAANGAIEHALRHGWMIQESHATFAVEYWFDTAEDLDAFARCSRRLREAAIASGEIEERRRQLSGLEGQARVRFCRTMRLDRHRRGFS